MDLARRARGGIEATWANVDDDALVRRHLANDVLLFQDLLGMDTSALRRHLPLGQLRRTNVALAIAGLAAIVIAVAAAQRAAGQARAVIFALDLPHVFLDFFDVGHNLTALATVAIPTAIATARR